MIFFGLSAALRAPIDFERIRGAAVIANVETFCLIAGGGNADEIDQVIANAVSISEQLDASAGRVDRVLAAAEDFLGTAAGEEARAVVATRIREAAASISDARRQPFRYTRHGGTVHQPEPFIRGAGAAGRCAPWPREGGQERSSPIGQRRALVFHARPVAGDLTAAEDWPRGFRRISGPAVRRHARASWGH